MSKVESEQANFKSLFDDIYHPNPNINLKASKKIALIWPEEAMLKLLENLQSNDIDTRRKSIKALGLFGKRVFAPVGNIFKSSNDSIICTSCLKVFVQLAVSMEDKFPPEAMEVIQLALKDDSPEVILTVVPLLKQIGIEGVPILIDLCKDCNILRASDAVITLGEIKDPIVEITFKELLERESIDCFVKESMARALNKNIL